MVYISSLLSSVEATSRSVVGMGPVLVSVVATAGVAMALLSAAAVLSCIFVLAALGLPACLNACSPLSPQVLDISCLLSLWPESWQL